jgi:hypothetical protein
MKDPQQAQDTRLYEPERDARVYMCGILIGGRYLQRRPHFVRAGTTNSAVHARMCACVCVCVCVRACDILYGYDVFVGTRACMWNSVCMCVCVCVSMCFITFSNAPSKCMYAFLCTYSIPSYVFCAHTELQVTAFQVTKNEHFSKGPWLQKIIFSMYRKHRTVPICLCALRRSPRLKTVCMQIEAFDTL